MNSIMYYCMNYRCCISFWMLRISLPHFVTSAQMFPSSWDLKPLDDDIANIFGFKDPGTAVHWFIPFETEPLFQNGSAEPQPLTRPGLYLGLASIQTNTYGVHTCTLHARQTPCTKTHTYMYIFFMCVCVKVCFCACCLLPSYHILIPIVLFCSPSPFPPLPCSRLQVLRWPQWWVPRDQRLSPPTVEVHLREGQEDVRHHSLLVREHTAPSHTPACSTHYRDE